MKIREIKKWNFSRVRDCCIINDFYTRGNNSEYEKMLDFVSTHKPTLTNIYKVAKDICEHSYEQTIENIMFCLSADAINTFYEIEE